MESDHHGNTGENHLRESSCMRVDDIWTEPPKLPVQFYKRHDGKSPFGSSKVKHFYTRVEFADDGVVDTVVNYENANLMSRPHLNIGNTCKQSLCSAYAHRPYQMCYSHFVLSFRFRSPTPPVGHPSLHGGDGGRNVNCRQLPLIFIN